jgi:hypothetical protein
VYKEQQKGKNRERERQRRKGEKKEGLKGRNGGTWKVTKEGRKGRKELALFVLSKINNIPFVNVQLQRWAQLLIRHYR